MACCLACQGTLEVDPQTAYDIGKQLAHSGKDERVPDTILNAPKAAQGAFLRAITEDSELKINSQLSAQTFLLLLRALGHVGSIMPLEGSRGGWMLKLGTGNTQPCDQRKVWGIWATPTTDKVPYVYDLTTANHHFQAGVGGLVVHNTDSVMVDFNSKSVEECFKLGQQAADLVSETFKRPIELEFEKCFSPYMLFSKKR